MAEQDELFSLDEVIPWRKEWKNMPEYSIEDLAPKYQLIVNFACLADIEDFNRLLDRNIKANGSKQLQSIWFPEQEIGRMMNKRYIEVKDES